MTKVNIMDELSQDYLYEYKKGEYEIKSPKEKGKHVRISPKVFDLMLSEGMIRKVDDGYVFVGKKEDLEAFKKKK